MSLTEYNELRAEATAAGVFERGDSTEDLRRKLKKAGKRRSTKNKRRKPSTRSTRSTRSIYSGQCWGGR